MPRKTVAALEVEVQQALGEIHEVKETVKEHDKFLLRGNGEPSVMENIRALSTHLDDLQDGLNEYTSEVATGFERLEEKMDGYIAQQKQKEKERQQKATEAMEERKKEEKEKRTYWSRLVGGTVVVIVIEGGAIAVLSWAAGLF